MNTRRPFGSLRPLCFQLLISLFASQFLFPDSLTARNDWWASPPVLSESLPDLTAFSGASSSKLELNQFFDDDMGDQGLVYSLISNSSLNTSVSVTDSFLTILPPVTGTDTATIIVRATDGDLLYIQDTLNLYTVEPTILFRINAGGESVSSSDAPNPDWETDDDNDPSVYHNTGSTKGNTSMNTRGAALPAYAPDELFLQERWDHGSAPEMEWEFPIGVAGVYQVNLFFMNNYGGTSAIGQRVFDVIIEGDTMLDDYDIVADAGHKAGTMKTLYVISTDGVLDIDFGHVTENPLVNGIEIIGPPVPPNNGQLTASVSRIHILTTETGSTSTDYPVILTNTGTEAIVISSAYFLGENANEFSSISSFPVTLNPSDQTTMYVSFSPDEAAIAQANLEISSNAGDGSDLEIPVFGEGMPAGNTATVLYRINQGGPQIAAADGSLPDWAEDQNTGGTTSGTAASGTPSSYLVSGGSHTFGTVLNPVDDGSVPDQVTASVFQSCRQDLAGGDDMYWSFPVDSGHMILVRCYFSENEITTVGDRIFSIEVEGESKELLNQLDLVQESGYSVSTIRSCVTTMLDDSLDVLFAHVAGNPMISGIEIVDLGLISIDFNATFTIHENDVNIDKSTYGTNSFKLYNYSDLGGKITSVTLDISTGVMNEMVFDPYGTAGDLVAKDFTIDTDPMETGYQSHALGLPHGNGGYQSVTVNFDDFEPGEWFGFSIDVDPSSTEGMPQPGPNDNASVSGLEMIGGTVTVTFAGGNTYSTTLFSDGSNAGVLACLGEDVPPAPSLTIEGGGISTESTSIYHTLSISGGTPNAVVSLLEAEAGFFETSPGAQAQQPNEMNSILSMRRVGSITLDGSGAGTIRVTTTRSHDEAGYNMYYVSEENGDCFGQVSNPVIIKYNPSSEPRTAYAVNAGGDQVISTNRDIFGKDDYFSPYPGKKSNNSSSIANTDDQNLFAADHWDNVPFSYEFPTGNGPVEVILQFAETYFNGPGSRVFQVEIEGDTVLVDFDIYAEALADPGNLTGSGKHYAVSRSFTTTVSDSSLSLSFFMGVNGADNPKVNAIQILPVMDAVFPVTWEEQLEAIPGDEQVSLTWATGNELNSDRFVVERRAENESFVRIDSIAAAGFSEEVRRYGIVDYTPLEGRASYRIRQIDLNGSETFSNTVEVELWNQTLKAFPQPVTETLSVMIPDAGEGLLRLFDLNGRELISHHLIDQTIIELNLTDMPAGLYTLIWTTEQRPAQVRRVVKNQ